MIGCGDDIEDIASSKSEINDSFDNPSLCCSSTTSTSSEELDDLMTSLNVPQPSLFDLRGKH